jgi:hypothetical protein
MRSRFLIEYWLNDDALLSLQLCVQPSLPLKLSLQPLQEQPLLVELELHQAYGRQKLLPLNL